MTDIPAPPMAGALLVFEPSRRSGLAWSAALSALMPELDIRVSPELGDPWQRSRPRSSGGRRWRDGGIAEFEAHHQPRRWRRPAPRRPDDPAAYPGGAARRPVPWRRMMTPVRHLRRVFPPLPRHRDVRAPAPCRRVALRIADPRPGVSGGSGSWGWPARRHRGADPGPGSGSSMCGWARSLHADRRRRVLSRRRRVRRFPRRDRHPRRPPARWTKAALRHIVGRDALYCPPRGAKGLINWWPRRHGRRSRAPLTAPGQRRPDQRGDPRRLRAGALAKGPPVLGYGERALPPAHGLDRDPRDRREGRCREHPPCRGRASRS